MDGSGNYCLSKYRSVFCRDFAGQSKPEFWKLIKTPGPGTYQVPSEFGIYRANDKFIKEYERKDRKRTADAERRKCSKSKTSQEMYDRKVKPSDLTTLPVSVDLKE